MILLDTDHVTHLKYTTSQRGMRLRQRLEAQPEGEIIGVPVVVVEEQMRGWLSTIAKERQAVRQVQAYQELADLFEIHGRVRHRCFRRTGCRAVR
jgi:tRNA(fMet)-specific endonuclease VapC